MATTTTFSGIIRIDAKAFEFAGSPLDDTTLHRLLTALVQRQSLASDDANACSGSRTSNRLLNSPYTFPRGVSLSANVSQLSRELQAEFARIA
jgi:hypothetical protein